MSKLTPKKPNKPGLCSDPTDPEFSYRVTDEDGVVWVAVPTEFPSAFVAWKRLDEFE